MNPIGSKAQRDELRQFVLGQVHAPEASYEALPRGTAITALDGLEIAERVMRGLGVLQVLWSTTQVGSLNSPQWDWSGEAWLAIAKALREWNDWSKP